MILLVTTKSDITVDSVIKHLNERKAPFIRLNTEDFPEKASLIVHLNKNSIEGILTLYDTHKVKLSEISACWFRHSGLTLPPDEPGISREITNKQFREFAKTEKDAFLNSLWKYLSNRFWINYPPIAQAAEGKLSNLQLAQIVGLEIPKTIITTNPQAAKDFYYSCNKKVVIKVLGGRIIKQKQKDFVVFTTLIKEEDLNNINSVQYAPTQLQEYIEKKIELRVTIVDKQIFACEIHSQDSEKTKIDWRHYDFANVKHAAHKLPKHIEKKLLKFMEIRGLNYGCFDLILTPEDRYVFIEINPSGEYLWIEEFANLPISKAIADLLINGSKKAAKKS